MDFPKLLIATNNTGKVTELRALLALLPIELVTPADIHLDLEVDEDGNTYSANATKKAVAFSLSSGLISLADDSGLEVKALGNAPGLHSARYLTRAGANDSDRRAYLLQNLRGLPRPWTACFRSTIAIAIPHKDVQLAEGRCDGEIIPEERGRGGFGYDRIFFLPGANLTMAELSMEQKNLLSHRAQAIMNAKPILLRIFEL